jgi:hypothetical protein
VPPVELGIVDDDADDDARQHAPMLTARGMAAYQRRVPLESAVMSDTESAKPMHPRDRRLYITLGVWAAIFVGVAVAGIGAFITGSPHWGAALLAVGLIGAYAVTLYLYERKPRPPPHPGPIIIGVAVLTWGFLGWQAWSAFRSPTQGYTQAQLDKAVEQATTKATASIQSQLDAALSDLAIARTPQVDANRGTIQPVGFPGVDIQVGSMMWDKNLYWGAIGNRTSSLMAFAYIRGTNTSNSAIQLKEASILSELTGLKQPLLVNIPYKGATPLDRVNAIPPGAAVDLIIEWKPEVEIKQFLAQWGKILVKVDYENLSYEQRYDEDYIRKKAIREFPQEGIGPRVTIKGEK